MASGLTAERLRELLDYDQATGAFKWRVGGNGRIAGSFAGCTSSDGALVISIDGKQYKGHDLAFLYVTGGWPERLVKYRDRNRRNCAWDNLRPSAGPKLTIKARGGKGAYRERGAWRVEVIDEHGAYRDGPFNTQTAAEAARQAAIKFRAALAADPEAVLAKERERAARRWKSLGYRRPGPPYYVRVELELRAKEEDITLYVLGPYWVKEEAEAIEAMTPEEIKQLADQQLLDLLNRSEKSWNEMIIRDHQRWTERHRPRIVAWRDDSGGTPYRSHFWQDATHGAPLTPEIETAFEWDADLDNMD